MVIIKYIFKFIKVLNSNIEPKQVGLGIAFGIALGLIPISTIHWWLILILMYITKSNLAAGGVFMALFKLIGMALGPVFDNIGYSILTIKSLESFYTQLYNTPVIPFTRYYNTVVISTTLFSIIFFIPFYIIFTKLVILYRTKVRDKIVETKWYKWFMKIPLIQKLVKLYGTVTKVKEVIS